MRQQKSLILAVALLLTVAIRADEASKAPCRIFALVPSAHIVSGIQDSKLLSPQKPDSKPRYLLGVLVELRGGSIALGLHPYVGSNHQGILDQMKIHFGPNAIQRTLWGGEAEFRGSQITKINESSKTVSDMAAAASLAGQAKNENNAENLKRFFEKNMPKLVHSEVQILRTAHSPKGVHLVAEANNTGENFRHDMANVFMVAKSLLDNYAMFFRDTAKLGRRLGMLADSLQKLEPVLNLLKGQVDSPALFADIEVIEQYRRVGGPKDSFSSEEAEKLRKAVDHIYRVTFESPDYEVFHVSP